MVADFVESNVGPALKGLIPWYKLINLKFPSDPLILVCHEYEHALHFLSTDNILVAIIVIFINQVVCYRQTPWYLAYVRSRLHDPLLPGQLRQPRQVLPSTLRSVNRWRHNEYSCCSHLSNRTAPLTVDKVRLVVWLADLIINDNSRPVTFAF